MLYNLSLLRSFSIYETFCLNQFLSVSFFLNDEKNFSIAFINFGGLIQMILFIKLPLFFYNLCNRAYKREKRTEIRPFSFIPFATAIYRKTFMFCATYSCNFLMVSSGFCDLNTALPATTTSAPAALICDTLSSHTPPSTSIR